MSRKTISIEALKASANAFLSASETFSNLETPVERAAQRMGVAGLLEVALHATDNYRGFNYLPSEKNEDGTLREGYDESRRMYY